MTGDRPRAFNSTLPARTTPFASATGLRRTAELRRGARLAPGEELRRHTGLAVVSGDGAPVISLRPGRRRGASPAEFPAKVRGLIHKRSGGFCEACAAPLPDGQGQCQHRVARGMGGSRNPLLGSAANGADLCGTPASGCHGRCEARDPEMHAMGFWLWSWENPLLVPVMLHSADGGVMVWLTADGGYSTEPPDGGAA